MRSKASIGGHPLHAMLIVIPAGGFIMALVLDIVFAASGTEMWWTATKPVLLVAVIGALIAAIPGLIDLVTVVPKGRATGVGIAHMVLNLVVVALGAVNVWLRWGQAAGEANSVAWLSVLTVALLAASGWLGWMMVQTYHVGVLEVEEGGQPPPRPAQTPAK